MEPKELIKLPRSLVLSWYQIGIISKKEFYAYEDLRGETMDKMKKETMDKGGTKMTQLSIDITRTVKGDGEQGFTINQINGLSEPELPEMYLRRTICCYCQSVRLLTIEYREKIGSTSYTSKKVYKGDCMTKEGMSFLLQDLKSCAEGLHNTNNELNRIKQLWEHGRQQRVVLSSSKTYASWEDIPAD